MKQLVTLCVHNPVFVNILLLVIIFAGAMAAATLVREVMPEFSADRVIVTVAYPGAGPEEVEEGISLKLEDAIEGIDGIKEYTTSSAENVGMAIIEVEEGFDLQKVKDDVTNRVNAIFTFPPDAEKPVITEFTLRSQVLYISLYGDVPERQLKEMAESVKDDLLREDNISQVSISGTRPYEISIEISEEKLLQYGLTFDEASRVVRTASQNFSGGSIKTEGEEFKIRTMGRRYTGKDYAGIIVMARPDGNSIRLDQIATIRDGFQEDEVRSRFKGYPAVMVQVFKTSDEDALRIASEAYAYVERKNMELPENIHMAIWADTSRFINERLDLLIRNGRLGLLLVFLLLLLFLDLKLSFWVSMGIPISLAGALGIMGITDQTINMISLFALIMILGIIVDDAIVVGESIYVHRKRGAPPMRAAVDGTLEVAWPVVAAVLTTIVAFLPLMFIGGIMGKFIRVLPLVVISALIISLLESLLLLPTHLRHLADPNQSIESNRHVLTRAAYRLRRWLTHTIEWFAEKVYYPVIHTVLAGRYITLACAIALLMITLGMVKGGFLKFQMFPDVDNDYLMMSIEFPDGTPIDITQRAIDHLTSALNKVAEDSPTLSGEPMINALVSTTGSITGYETEVGSHLGQIIVELLPTEERGIYFRDIISRWEKQAGPIAGALSVSFESSSAGPPGKPLEIWLMGDDLNVLRQASDELKAHLGNFSGVFQIEDDYRPGKREVRLRLKPEARNLNLTTSDIGNQLRQGFYGDEALRVQRGRDDIKVWLRYPLSERRSLSDIEAVKIRTPDGREVPLRSVATLDIEQGYSTIVRTDGMRRIAVTADVDNNVANAAEITADLEHGFLVELMQRHPGLYASIEGEKKESVESLSSLAIGFPLAMMGIFLILASMFRSYVQPVVIMVTIPFGLIGAFYGHILLGFDLTMLSLFGMVALAGIVVNDAIILIECYNERLMEGITIRKALCLAGQRRFRAIMLTTLTTSCGLAPIILEKSMQAQFLIPMAISIAFGVAFATLLTLLVIPCLLMILNDLRRTVRYLVSGVWPAREEVEPAIMRIREEKREEQIPSAYTLAQVD